MCFSFFLLEKAIIDIDEIKFFEENYGMQKIFF